MNAACCRMQAPKSRRQGHLLQTVAHEIGGGSQLQDRKVLPHYLNTTTPIKQALCI